MENIGSGASVMPSLTRSTCLTCNRPLGKSVGLGAGGGGQDGGDWRRPPTSVAEQHRLGSEKAQGKEVMVLNKDVPISSLKKLSDSQSSPTTVGTLIADPRKQKISVNKKSMQFMNDDGAVGVMEQVPNRVVSRYPGRMLPPKNGVK